jgi:hypothetical protein
MSSAYIVFRIFAGLAVLPLMFFGAMDVVFGMDLFALRAVRGVRAMDVIEVLSDWTLGTWLNVAPIVILPPCVILLTSGVVGLQAYRDETRPTHVKA